MKEVIDVEPRAEDFELAAKMFDAKQALQALEYQASCIKHECARRLEALRTHTEQAKARVRRLQPAYADMQRRLHIDPITDLDIEEDEQEDGDALDERMSS